MTESEIISEHAMCVLASRGSDVQTLELLARRLDELDLQLHELRESQRKGNMITTDEKRATLCALFDAARDIPCRVQVSTDIHPGADDALRAWVEVQDPARKLSTKHYPDNGKYFSGYVIVELGMRGAITVHLATAEMVA